jgi:hypothetical protein
MDNPALVTASNRLLEYLDKTEMSPRAVLWVSNSDHDSWKLWVVPKKGFTDKQNFYRIVSEQLSKHRDVLGAVDIAMIEMKEENHPAIQGASKAFRVEGNNSIYVSENSYNGFYMPDGVILRLAI